MANDEARARKKCPTCCVRDKMRNKGKDAKEEEKKTRNRSDLVVNAFGEETRNKDNSLTGSDLSPHWNPGKGV